MVLRFSSIASLLEDIYDSYRSHCLRISLIISRSDVLWQAKEINVRVISGGRY